VYLVFKENILIATLLKRGNKNVKKGKEGKGKG
jgi:hypothetical protein